jgi:hypothetical protein
MSFLNEVNRFAKNIFLKKIFLNFKQLATLRNYKYFVTLYRILNAFDFTAIKSLLVLNTINY